MKKAVSGFLAALTLLSTVLSPVYASEVQPKEPKPPLYEEVKNQLDTDEVVKAEDLELDYGSTFDVKLDFTKIEIPDKEKVKVTFEEAKNETGEEFSTEKADTYKAVYYVEPTKTDHPKYQISRKLIVKEPQQEEIQTVGTTDIVQNDAEISEEESDSDGETQPGEETDSDIDSAEDQEPSDTQETPVTEVPDVEVEPSADQEMEETPVEPEEPKASEEIEQLLPETEENEEIEEKTDDGSYKVEIVKGDEYNITLNHEDGKYAPGEIVEFSADIAGLPAVETTMVEANKDESNADLMYSEVTYNEETGTYSFVMPEDDITLGVSTDQAEGGIMLTASGDPWDDATEIEANKYYYYSDGQLHPFDSIMGQGGNDSYKYVRYKVDGKTYTVTGYVIDTKAYGVKLVAGSSTSHTFGDDYVTASIHLVKKDKETGNVTQGDAKFEGAVYGLYAREDIVHPDGKSGVLYKKNTQVATMNVDAAGNAQVDNLFLGKYYVKEITPPAGYLLDEEEHDVECSYEGGKVKNIERTIESSEQVNKQPFQVIKAANNGKTDADLLKGAGFSAYLASSLKEKEDGSYDFTGAQPVVITEDGKTEMFTDAKGYAKSIPLPYGKYVVRETTTPHNYNPVDDFIVIISENYPDEPQTWRVLLDDEFKAKLKIIKKDDETKKSVLVAGTEFKIYDMDHKKYVEQVTSYPTVQKHTSYFTDSDGYLILPENLKIGHYRVEEVTAPDGYTINKNYVEISVDANTAYLQESETGDTIIEVEYENHPVKGELSIYKKGEVLADYDGKDFQYEEKYLSGAEFEVYAAENIFTADYQKDAEGNRILEYAEGTLVTTVTTDGSGLAVVKNLPLGKYLVKEANAPTGFVLNSVPQETSMEYADQNTAVIKESVTFDDTRQKVEINVEKQDAENGATVAGAGFGIYNAEDLVNDEGKIIVKADTLLQEMTSDENGNVTFTLDLPLGKYYVKELKAPAGFVSSDEILNFDASYQGQNTTVVSLKEVKKNQPTTVEITKSDITTGTELDGANMRVLDKEGNVIDEWTSVKDQPHVIKRLVVGEEYTLREEIAPYGYLKATDVKFRLEDTAEIQKVEMKDEVPMGLLIINKKGEFLDKVTLLDSAKGTVEHLFEYISGNLTEVTFEVYAAEDIKAADGVSADYYKADDLVGTITTDDKGIAQLENLPAGKYYVKETATAHGYVLDSEIRYVDLSYRDQDTPVITFDEDWQNARQKVIVQVLKKEKNVDRVLAGGVFGLYAAEDIRSVSGKVLLKADEIIEQKTTDENGQISFLADLPVDGKYYVKELKAPDGFVTTEEKQEFTFEYKGENVTEVPYEFTCENEPTTVELTKSDLTTGEELPGAHLKVTDKDGNIVDEWISEKNPHVIKELTVGKKYTLTETKPADGFVTAESIEFTVENTAEIQRHEMKDDITKVQISKTDITGDKEIPGAKLIILDKNDQVVENWISTDKPHYVEKLPVGNYTLREEQAPKGFVLTSDVTFEVKDTGEVQTVTMKNDTVKGKIIINKTDADTEKPLKGVEYEIQNSKGKVLEKLVTDAAGHAESSLYEIASYKNGKFNKAIKYYLVETKALDGYELDQTKYEIVFEYADQYTPVIEVKKALTNKETQPGESDEAQPHDSGSTERTSPKTGDTTNLLLPVILLFAAAGTMAGILIRRKKLNTEKKNND